MSKSTKEPIVTVFASKELLNGKDSEIMTVAEYNRRVFALEEKRKALEPRATNQSNE